MTVISDATNHEVFHNNPCVTDEPHIRFYMSRRLETPEGFPAGTLCVFDDEPFQPEEPEVEMMKDFASMAESELEKQLLSEEQERLIEELEDAERRASTDALTRAWNKAMIKEILDRELGRALREDEPISLCMLDIDHFKQVNDQYGHPVGDQVLAEVARRIRQSIRPYDGLGRYGGEEFMIVFVESDLEEAQEIAERVRKGIAADLVEAKEWDVDVTVSLGVTTLMKHDNRDQMIGRADELLYEAKEDGRNRVVAG